MKVVLMDMLTATAVSTWLVANREVHRVVRREKLELVHPCLVHTGAGRLVSTENKVMQLYLGSRLGRSWPVSS